MADVFAGPWPQFVTVYMFEHIQTKKAYVGSTKGKPNDRRNAHLLGLNNPMIPHHSPILQNYWNKYGADSFRFVVLEQKVCKDKKERVVFEAHWVGIKGSLNCRPVTEDRENFTIREEDRRHLSKMSKRKWEDPIWVEKALTRVREGWSNPKKKRERLELNRITRSTPEFKEAHSKKMREVWTKDKRKQQSKKCSVSASAISDVLSKNMSNRWKDPEKRPKYLEGMARSRTPEKNARNGASVKKSWTPERKLAQSKRTTEMNVRRKLVKNLKSLAQAKATVIACLENIGDSGTQ